MWAELGSRQGIAETDPQRALIHKPGLFFYKSIVDKTAFLMLIFSVILSILTTTLSAEAPSNMGSSVHQPLALFL